MRYRLFVLFCASIFLVQNDASTLGANQTKELLAFVGYSWVGEDEQAKIIPHLYLWDPQTDEIRVLGDNINTNTAISWSYDGRLAWETWDGKISVWNGQSTTIISTQFNDHDRLEWSCDGRLAWATAFSSDTTTGGEIFIWDGITSQNISLSPVVDSDPSWSPDGQLAWNSWRNEPGHWIRVWNQNTKTIVNKVPSIGEPVWSDDNRLAWTTLDETIQVWDGQAITTVSAPASVENDSAAWSHDGRLAWISGKAPRSIIVWDGKSSTQISGNPLPDKLIWTFDDHLMWPGNYLTNEIYMPGVYYWDGNTTTQISIDYYPPATSRSRDGRFASRPSRNGKPSLYVWDGHNIQMIMTGDEVYQAPHWSTDYTTDRQACKS